MKKTYDVNSSTVTFTFDGGLAPVVFNAEAMTNDVRHQAMLHGFTQKIGDAAAISKSAENGWTVTESARRNAVEAMVEQLISGNWNERKAAGLVRSPIIAELARKAGVDYDAMAARLANMDIAALMGN